MATGRQRLRFSIDALLGSTSGCIGVPGSAGFAHSGSVPAVLAAPRSDSRVRQAGGTTGHRRIETSACGAVRGKSLCSKRANRPLVGVRSVDFEVFTRTGVPPDSGDFRFDGVLEFAGGPRLLRQAPVVWL